jgi:hypothetical protein
MGSLDQLSENELSPVPPLVLHYLIEGLNPLFGLREIRVGQDNGGAAVLLQFF